MAAQKYEIVLFTSGTQEYAEQAIAAFDVNRRISHALFRQHTTKLGTHRIKNLGRLGRDLKRTIIVDNSPLAYALQIKNALPINSWYSDIFDNELWALVEKLNVLSEYMEGKGDVRVALDSMYSLEDQVFPAGCCHGL
jgi:TFIIF-interacting CTD phosphatase-like protein